MIIDFETLIDLKRRISTWKHQNKLGNTYFFKKINVNLETLLLICKPPFLLGKIKTNLKTSRLFKNQNCLLGKIHMNIKSNFSCENDICNSIAMFPSSQ